MNFEIQKNTTIKQHSNLQKREREREMLLITKQTVQSALSHRQFRFKKKARRVRNVKAWLRNDTLTSNAEKKEKIEKNFVNVNARANERNLSIRFYICPNENNAERESERES